MKQPSYEPHIYQDPALPILFHLDELKKTTNFLTHWHENIELLHVVEGSIMVTVGIEKILAQPGETVIVSSNRLHHVQSVEDCAKYDCLIIDKGLCESCGFSLEETDFQALITDPFAEKSFEKIRGELEKKQELYRGAIKSAVADFVIYLYRTYRLQESSITNLAEGLKANTIKQAIRYIQGHYGENISTEDVARKIGLSEAYFCRIFKENTGHTVLSYIHLLRCLRAKELFQSGEYLVNEVALLCGFENDSYFSKIYKKYIGCTPSASKLNQSGGAAL